MHDRHRRDDLLATGTNLGGAEIGIFAAHADLHSAVEKHVPVDRAACWFFAVVDDFLAGERSVGVDVSDTALTQFRTQLCGVRIPAGTRESELLHGDRVAPRCGHRRDRSPPCVPRGVPGLRPASRHRERIVILRDLPMQLLKLAGYKSFWFCRGVPNDDLPSEFLWQGIDGTKIPTFSIPGFYGLFYGPPASPKALPPSLWTASMP